MVIDLRSDTVTKPTAEMRNAIYHAEVGDDVYGEDPSINKLESAAAEILGKEAALFVTSGTQGNIISVLSQTVRGDEVIVDEASHIFNSENGALASIAGVQPRPLESTDGRMSLSRLTGAVEESRGEYQPETRLICLENTHGQSGGTVLPLDYMKNIHQISREYDIPVHLDGSRIFNAASASKIEAREIAQYADTVQFCLSKGLGAPMGSVMAGSQEVIERAKKWRKTLGGGMRQAGIAGAAGIVALENMVERLGEDHANAQKLSNYINSITGLEVVNTTDTNIILVSVEKLGISASDFILKLAEEGVLAGQVGPSLIRMVTHHDITGRDITEACEVIGGLDLHIEDEYTH